MSTTSVLRSCFRSTLTTRVTPMFSAFFRNSAVCAALAVATAVAALGQSTDQQVDQAIKDKLAAPPLSLDEQHPGPTMVPKDLPSGIFPFDCRATEAYLHRVRPGEYHFQRAQRLLGEGIDVIGCEAFGLERFHQDKSLLGSTDQAVREAEAAVLSPLGLEQWRPGAAKYLLMSAYRAAAKAYLEEGRKQKSGEYIEKGKEFSRKLAVVEKESDQQIANRANGTRSPLLNAVVHNDLKLVNEQISSGMDVNAMDADHTSALRLAVVAGNSEMVDFLLSKEARPDIADEEGVTALMDACALGREDVAVALIRAGADVNGRAADGSTPLLNAIGHISITESARQSRVHLVQTLVDDKAAVNVFDWQGTSPLLAASRSGNTDLARLLLSAGANIEATDAKGQTPLLSAIEQDNVDMVRLLIESKANLAVFDKGGNSPLSKASQRGFPEGAKMTQLLLNAGADPNLPSQSGWTPLMSAEAFIYREPWGVSSHIIVSELLKRGARVNARTKTGTTPLIQAAAHVGPDDSSFVADLIAAGADVNAADDDGETALMGAAENGQLSKVKLLIENGARVDAKDKLGRTALQYARPPRNAHDDEFPQCYGTVSNDTLKPTNDCAGTRQLLRAKQTTSR